MKAYHVETQLIKRLQPILRRALFAVWVLLVPVESSQAEMVMLNPVADTFILDTSPTNNNGGTEGFTVGRDDNGGTRRGLIRFDVSGIPSGSTILSAVLELTVTKDPPQPVNTNFHLYKLLLDWGEGDKVGSRPFNRGEPATSGEATWEARLTGQAAWTTAGALDDVTLAPSATTYVEGAGPYTWDSVSMTADVQEWVNAVSQNFGWLIVCADELTPMTARKFGSREPTPNPSPPVLQVEFIPPPQLIAPTWSSASTFEFEVRTLAGTTNIVEMATSLSTAPDWEAAAVVVPTNETFLFFDPAANSDSARIYRVVRQ